MRRALLGLLALLGGCGENPCREETALVAISLGPEVAALAVEEVEIAVSGARAVTVTRSWPKGATRARVEIEFPAGYPVGAELVVEAAARRTDASIGRARSATYLGEGCAAIEMSIDALDCGGVSLCIEEGSCWTQTCVDACRVKASVAGRQQHDALAACVAAACPATSGKPCEAGLASGACRACYAAAVVQGGDCWIDHDDCLGVD